MGGNWMPPPMLLRLLEDSAILQPSLLFELHVRHSLRGHLLGRQGFVSTGPAAALH